MTFCALCGHLPDECACPVFVVMSGSEVVAVALPTLVEFSENQFGVGYECSESEFRARYGSMVN